MINRTFVGVRLTSVGDKLTFLASVPLHEIDYLVTTATTTHEDTQIIPPVSPARQDEDGDKLAITGVDFNHPVCTGTAMISADKQSIIYNPRQRLGLGKTT